MPFACLNHKFWLNVSPRIALLAGLSPLPQILCFSPPETDECIGENRISGRSLAPSLKCCLLAINFCCMYGLKSCLGPAFCFFFTICIFHLQKSMNVSAIFANLARLSLPAPLLHDPPAKSNECVGENHTSGRPGAFTLF